MYVCVCALRKYLSFCVSVNNRVGIANKWREGDLFSWIECGRNNQPLATACLLAYGGKHCMHKAANQPCRPKDSRTNEHHQIRIHVQWEIIQLHARTKRNCEVKINKKFLLRFKLVAKPRLRIQANANTGSFHRGCELTFGIAAEVNFYTKLPTFKRNIFLLFWHI